MHILDKYNSLQGETLSLTQVNKLVSEAKKNNLAEVVFRLERMLFNHPGQNEFYFKSVTKVEKLSEEFLCGIDQMNDQDDDGLGKAVSPEQIYDMITNKVLDAISSGKKLPWRKPWGSMIEYGMLATNFDSKKPYRGINALLLNALEDFSNPYFMTFNQIKKHKGKLRKGSKGHEVVYFTILYKYDQDNADGKLSIGTYDLKKFKAWIAANKSKISILKNGGDKYLASFIDNATRPILKYYKVFSGDDIEGIDWKLKKIGKKKTVEKIDTAEAIVKSMPKRPEITHKVNGNNAFYRPSTDSITMPAMENFESAERYYGVLFHELVHSTGAQKRVGRSLKGRSPSPEYAFEELIAELGATFLNAESGTLFHTFDNSAAYLKGWTQSLTQNMRKDNKFFFRASSKAQAAADFILDRDKSGMPKYIKIKRDETKTTQPDQNDQKNWASRSTYENDFDIETVKRSYYWSSFSPDKRAEQDLINWKKEMSDSYVQLKKLAEKEGFSMESLNHLFDKFHARIKKMKSDVNAARSRTASSAVTGPAKFPTAKNNKAQEVYFNKLNKYVDAWNYGINKIKKKIFPTTTIKSGDKNAVQLLNIKLNNQEKIRQITKDFNKNYLGNKSTKIDRETFIVESGLTQAYKAAYPNKGEVLLNARISDAIKGDKLVFLYLSKEILDVKKRIKGEEIRAKELENNKGYRFNSGEVVFNTEINRVQLIFDSKPDEETRKVLKSNGYRWSPKNTAWQRQMTRAAISVTKRLFPGIKSSKVREKVQKPIVKTPEKSKLLVDEKTGQTALFGIDSDDPLFTIASEKKKDDIEERFQLKGVLGDYLGMIQRFRLLILLKGDTHAGKSELVMQLANAFIETGFSIAYFDLEQGGMESADTLESMNRNIPVKNRSKLAMAGMAPNGIDTIFEYGEMADVVIIDSFQKLGVVNTRMDELRIKFPHTMFITIFQQNAEGGTRGGVSADFDTPIILKVHKVGDVAFVNNYTEILKNRGNSDKIGSRYSMYKKVIIS